MLFHAVCLLCVAAGGVVAQESDDTTTTPPAARTSSSRESEETSAFSFTNSILTTLTGSDIPSFTYTGSMYTYAVVTGQTTVTTTVSATVSADNSSATSNSQITASTRSVELTQLGGTASPTNGTGNSTSTATSSAARPTNTVPCNGWPEFCTRKYSNISMVTSHNSAFVVKNNAASNQMVPILTQLDNGVRMLQGEVHWVNNTLYNCHTSCDQLNAGTWQSLLETMRQWLSENPYDVLSFLIVNSNFVDVENFVPAITNAGVLPYLYTPSYIPQYRDQWPTLGEMILRNDRLVIFMDYKADQARVPYVLDEFTHIWETPFSPTDQAFPCTQQRPPDLNQTRAKEEYMYLANHNLNTAVDLSAIGINVNAGNNEPILIPNTAELNITNSAEEIFGSAEKARLNCTEMWDRPPNFFLVDYYNIGSPQPCSIFEVTARANNVPYDGTQCGKRTSGAESLFQFGRSRWVVLMFAMLLAFVM